MGTLGEEVELKIKTVCVMSDVAADSARDGQEVPGVGCRQKERPPHKAATEDSSNPTTPVKEASSTGPSLKQPAPAEEQRQETSSVKFTFVIKTAHSRSLSNSTDDKHSHFQIRSHVTRNQRRTREHPMRWISYNKNDADPTSQPFRNPRKVRKDVPRSSLGPIQVDGQPDIERQSRSSNQKDSMICTARREKHMSGAYLYSAESLHSASLNANPGSAVDPFNTCPLPLDTKTAFLMWYFSGVWAPIAAATGHIGGGFGPTSSLSAAFHPSDLSSISRANADSVVGRTHLQCLLAASAARMKCFSPETVGFLYDSPERYIVSALRALRTQLEDGGGINDHMILDIWYLALAEFYSSNLSGSRIHLRQIRTFITRQGGIRRLSPYVAWLCLSADHLICACKLTVPTFDLRANPELLGLSRPRRDENFQAILAAAVEELEPRIRCIVEENNHMIELIGAVNAVLCRVQEVSGNRDQQVEMSDHADATLRFSMTLWLLHRFKITCCPGKTDIRFQAVMELICLNSKGLQNSMRDSERSTGSPEASGQQSTDSKYLAQQLWAITVGYIACFEDSELQWFGERLKRTCCHARVTDLWDLVSFFSKEPWCRDYILVTLTQEKRLQEFFNGRREWER